ncbi:hypothetical protein ACHMW5_13620 [Azospirillum melinis]|uniref:hypothetical protein n=1 Tax=Azospirillum melinis TaxID=328839 RepID=UPI0037568816
MTDRREALERLTRWRDQGKYAQRAGYGEGVRQFYDDVRDLLSTVEQLREALDLIANTGMDARQCMLIARAALQPAPTEDKP